MESVPFMVTAVNVLAPLFERVRLLNVFPAPPIDCTVPLKLIVPVFELKVPLFVQLPLTDKVFVLPVSVAPLLMVMFRHTLPETPTVGAKVVPVGIMISVVEVGTPPHQLEAVFQSVLVEPIHVPGANTVTAPETVLVAVSEFEFVKTT